MSGSPSSTCPTVVVVSGGGFQGLAVIKALRASGGIRVVVADCHPIHVGGFFADRVYRIPPVAEGGAFLARLEEICREERAVLVVPSTDHELTTLADHAEAFEAMGSPIAVSKPSFLKIARDKRDLTELLSDQGFPTLPTLDPADPSSLEYPILAKPVSGWGGRGALVLGSPRDLIDFLATNPIDTYLLQPYLGDFEELSIDFAIDFEGRISPLVLRSRVRTSGGFAVICDEAHRPEVVEVADAIARMIGERGGRGLFNLQVLVTADGFYFTDLNPRIGTSSVFAIGLGQDLIGHLLGREPSSPSEPRPPQRMVRFLQERWISSYRFESIRAVVFDLDDTLLDQERWILAKLDGLWELFSDRLPDRETFLTEGAQAVEEGDLPFLLDRLIARLDLDQSLRDPLIEEYRQLLPGGDFLYEDVRDELVDLRRSGYLVGLLTDNPPRSQQQKIDATGLDQLIHAAVFTRDFGAEKPATRGFLELVDRLGLLPRQVVMVGDNPYRDLRGAQDAGYGAAFWIRRPGCSFRPDLLPDGLIRPQYRIELRALRELRWFLGEGPEAGR